VASTGNRATASGFDPRRPAGSIPEDAVRSAPLLRKSIVENASEHRPRWLAVSFIQDICQCGMIGKSSLFQYVGRFAAH
jgi:hypothetical protein